jgi:hypothetical protein
MKCKARECCCSDCSFLVLSLLVGLKRSHNPGFRSIHYFCSQIVSMKSYEYLWGYLNSSMRILDTADVQYDHNSSMCILDTADVQYDHTVKLCAILSDENPSF